MTRRPELLSSVMLRQNPHNVHEWHKRARLFSGQPAKQILTYTEAVKTVDPDKVGTRVVTAVGIGTVDIRHVVSVLSRSSGVLAHADGPLHTFWILGGRVV